MSQGPGANEARATYSAAEPWRLWHMLVLVLNVAVFLWAYTAIGGWAVVLLILLLVTLIVGWVFMAIRGHASQQHALLWMLAIAAEHRMPLATTVEAFANQYRGWFRRRVLRLAALLDQGASLSFALRDVRGLASADSAMLVEMGEESGRLGPTLRRAAAIQSSRSAVGATLASQASYLLILLLITQVITGFLLYFIVPKFEAIFLDFGVALPTSTKIMLSGAHFATSQLLVPIWLPLLTLGLLFIIPRALTGGAGFDFPLIGRLFRRRHAALILRSLAMTAESKRPIEDGLHTLASRYPTRWVRRRIAAAEDEVRRGVDWREALARQGLIRATDHEVLNTAAAVGNLPWAMNDLADAADRRTALRMSLLAQAIWPFVILSLGALVMFLAVGFFAPLVELIGRLAG
ncbi:type II secretion system F family protein [Paludisphaera mucosa]|uniref:Type II secretion system F family protein n=1 Tax=Paludisphaera mucosa TaxID=3030827 RepID=A0ABT6F8V2_9BACT|nr:type II secretion system F family protein [Paludisphaera mucosa]MDG3004020.1 type II secretion system F family protein [Paludisphaera mucosa]